MNLRSLSLLAATVLLLAACKQTPPDSGNQSGATSTASPAPTTASSGVVKGSREDFIQNVGDRVFFDFDKSDIKPEGRQTLDKQATWLKQYASVTVTIEGNCDDRGTREYNLALGNRRANAVKNALVALGIPASRIQTISYGKERPSVVGDNEAAWAQNRNGITAIN
jgi:peptidoglycan-associated lipoprotein